MVFVGYAWSRTAKVTAFSGENILYLQRQLAALRNSRFAEPAGSDVEMSSSSAANLTFDAEILSQAVEILRSAAELVTVGADTLRPVTEIFDIVSFCRWDFKFWY